MKNRSMKLIITGLVALFMIFSMVTPTIASTKDEFINEKKVVTKFISKYQADTSYTDIIKLYDFNDEVSYLFFVLDNGGYAIVDIKNECIVESSSDKNLFIDNNKEKYYYNGPLAYFVKREGKIWDLTLQKYIDENVELKSITPKIELNDNDNNSIVPYAETEYGVYLKGTLPNYSYNPNGICGSTAAAMFLRYWDTWHNGNYVPSSLETSDGISLIKNLVPYIDGSSPGSSPEELRAGIDNYLKSRGIYDGMFCETYSNNRVKERINNNKPFVLGLTNHPTYGEHWVTAYGYFMELGSFKYIIVNNGWGSSGVYINPGYCDYIVF